MLPYYFGLLSITETLTLIFTALGLLISSVTVLITVKGLKLAYHAMKEWKKQKKWDVILESKAFTTPIYTTFILNDLKFYSDIQKIKGKSENSKVYALKVFDLLNEKPFFPMELEIEILKIYDLVKTTLNNQNELESYLIDFYDIAFKILMDFNKEKLKAISDLNELTKIEISKEYQTSNELKIIVMKEIERIESVLEEFISKHSEKIKEAYFIIIENNSKYTNIKL